MSQFSHSVMSDSLWPHFPVHRQLSKLAQTHVHWVSDAIQPSHPLLSPSPPAFPIIRVFSNESVLHIRWPKYWSFSFSISPSNDYLGVISFRIDWLDLLAVQGTLKSLLQHHSSKASILRYLAFFMVQLSYPYMTTGKTIALTKQTFISKIMSLLFSMLSRLVIAFLPRSKCLLTSWLQSPSAVTLEPKKTVSHCFHWSNIHKWLLPFRSCFTWWLLKIVSLSPRESFKASSIRTVMAARFQKQGKISYQ